MQDQLDFLHLIAERLDGAGIPFMLTGSLAMALYAEPRMTRDIDLVVECEGRTTEDLVELFQDVCYISADAVREALATGGMFNIIHLEGVSKADFVVRRPEEYRRTEFARRRFMDIGGRGIPVVAPEDLILSKLLWWIAGDSEVQRADLRLLLESLEDIDRDYIECWAQRLGALARLKELMG
ncbi:MAG: nucleotidyl transferase AbiEii/AbiGii toxin family protein [Krumholzibacteria bacterium]|nr:nucleotidyl transferase AbiEii/AbiGii toxin family protein [Candidatus Krumholzibacteria bacterium]